MLEAVLPLIERKEHPAWQAQIDAWRSDDVVPPASALDGKLHPYDIIHAVAELAGEDAIIVTDVGQHQMWAAQYCGRTQPRSFLTSGGLGTMGFGYGAAIGAQVAFPKRRVIHITGDGCFHMNLNELCTSVSYNLPVITVVFNNGVLGMVRQWQDLFYGKRYSATVLNDNVDFVKLAEALGAEGVRVTTQEEFKEAFARALTLGKPIVIDCQIGSDDKVWPMVAPGAAISEAFDGKDLEQQK